MVEAGALAAPDAAIAMRSLEMHALVQAFGNDAPLHGEVLVVVERCVLIHGPAHGAMIHDDILVANAIEGIIGLFAFIT
ncbi:hypothetical protein D3C87_2150070 [compost metagenome]